VSFTLPRRGSAITVVRRSVSASEAGRAPSASAGFRPASRSAREMCGQWRGGLPPSFAASPLRRGIFAGWLAEPKLVQRRNRPTSASLLPSRLRRYGATSRDATARHPSPAFMSEGWWPRFVPDGTACSLGSNWLEGSRTPHSRPAQRFTLYWRSLLSAVGRPHIFTSGNSLMNWMCAVGLLRRVAYFESSLGAIRLRAR